MLRLYERRASSPPSQRARVAPSALALPRENLARYFSSLRVEIAGPLGSDSLAQLLDSLDLAE